MASLKDIAAEDAEAKFLFDRLAADAPAYDPSLDWIWQTWERLSSDRPYFGGGMGQPVPGRIPWAVLHTWAVHHGLSHAELSLLDSCVGAMDGAYLEWWSSTQVQEP